MIGKKVLIIDDDAQLLQLAGLIFKKAGAQTLAASDGPDGLQKMRIYQPDLIILDVVMPGMDGFEVCRRIRQTSDSAILILTALNQEMDMLNGLDAGADDFLSKPFNPEILLARSRTILRRGQHSMLRNPVFRYSDGFLEIDVERRQIRLGGQLVKLTGVEFRLLTYLARNAGKVLTFDQILTNVWGNDYRGSIEHVHVFISHLRKKLREDTRNPRYIMTLHGIGYIFERPEFGYRP
ncbi:MAG TPA: response regulator transcription factor [Anaerolineales bacterium]